jgi:succinyl-diaminopimelate desuccinylase
VSLAADRARLLAWIEAEREEMISLFSRFVRARSPNPPGDTREAAGLLRDWLGRQGHPVEVIAPVEHAPNLVSSFDGGRPGGHLVLNGHIDVFPCDDAERWSRDPWGGEVVDGRLYGRGASDMKNGTLALLFAYGWLARLADRLPGRLTLTAVSDEETGGTDGAGHLADTRPDLLGDCLLNAEPGAPTTIRFGEKGILRAAILVETPGCHGAYTHKSPSASRIAARIIGRLGRVAGLPVRMDAAVERALDAAADEIDRIHGAGAARVMKSFTLNVGVVRSGTKINMLPGAARIECDLRVPVGETSAPALACLREILGDFPEARLEVMGSTEPTWSDPGHGMVGALRAACRVACGFEPLAITSLGATDARKWREKGVPAFTYGTTATNVAMADEHTDLSEWFGVVKTLTLAAHGWLAEGAGL